MNILLLSGRLAADPEIRIGTKSKKPLTTGKIAVRRRNFSGEETTMWVPITAFGRSGEEFASYKKGNPITVRGTLEISNTKNPDGTYRNYSGITVSEFLTTEGSSSSAGSEKRTPPTPVPAAAPATSPEDDMYDPFED